MTTSRLLRPTKRPPARPTTSPLLRPTKRRPAPLTRRPPARPARRPPAPPTRRQRLRARPTGEPRPRPEPRRHPPADRQPVGWPDSGTGGLPIVLLGMAGLLTVVLLVTPATVGSSAEEPRLGGSRMRSARRTPKRRRRPDPGGSGRLAMSSGGRSVARVHEPHGPVELRPDGGDVASRSWPISRWVSRTEPAPVPRRQRADVGPGQVGGIGGHRPGPNETSLSSDVAGADQRVQVLGATAVARVDEARRRRRRRRGTP